MEKNREMAWKLGLCKGLIVGLRLDTFITGFRVQDLGLSSKP